MAPRKKQDAVTRILQTKNSVDKLVKLAPKSAARMQALNSAARPNLAQIQKEARTLDKVEKFTDIKGKDARAAKEGLKSLLGFRPVPGVSCRKCGAETALRAPFCPKCGERTRMKL